jgi:hypothetical protein
MICKAPTQYTAEPAQKLCNVHKWLTHSSVCRPVSIPPLKKHKGKIHCQFKHRRKTLKLTQMSFKIQLAFKHHDTGNSSLSYDGQRLYSTTNYFNTESHWKDSTKEECITPASLARGRPIWFNSASISSILLLIIAKILGIRALITASRCCSPETHQHLCFTGAAKITTCIYKRTSPTSAKTVTRYLR